MSLKNAILTTVPTSYWPLDDVAGPSCHDEMGNHDALVSDAGITLAVIPFGQVSAPYFDGEIGSYLTVPDDPRYSQPSASALSVAAWICPLTLDNSNVGGPVNGDHYVHVLEKSVDTSTDVEWLMRLYNDQNPTRHSRLSFYTFNLGSPAREGNGAYMEYNVSNNDLTPVELGRWLFVVGQAEPWVSSGDLTTGCIFWKQNVQAKRISADKYGTYHVHPQDGSGPLRIGGTSRIAYKGSIAHVAIWNRLLSSDEISSIWSEGLTELQDTPMYRGYV
jgi:hypothetical protein